MRQESCGKVLLHYNVDLPEDRMLVMSSLVGFSLPPSTACRESSGQSNRLQAQLQPHLSYSAKTQPMPKEAYQQVCGDHAHDGVSF